MFYRYSNIFDINLKLIQILRHNLILKYDAGLFEFQRDSKYHSITKILSISKNDKFKIDNETELGNDFVIDVFKNVQIVKELHTYFTIFLLVY